jgi:hypothetical protein
MVFFRILTTQRDQKMYTHFNRYNLQAFSKLNQYVMYSVYCDVLSRDGTSHMNARATLSNGRTVTENGTRTVVI